MQGNKRGRKSRYQWKGSQTKGVRQRDTVSSEESLVRGVATIGIQVVKQEGEEIIEGGRGGRSLVAILLVHLFAAVSYRCLLSCSHGVRSRHDETCEKRKRRQAASRRMK